MSLTLSFDIGYASIGWCVLSSTDSKSDPEFLGTGVVTFPTDDCLASKRRDLRRTRRHIRSTRQRIERMKRWLVHRNVLSRADLDKPGHPAPFLLAAAALQDHRTLNAWELWTVLRWYAHNRGYDGNSLWSREEINADDTAKEVAAKALMTEHNTQTMAETVCACLKLDPAKSNKTISSHLPYKTLNAAYPRSIVQNEVLALLKKHLNKIPGLDDKTLDLLFTPEALRDEDRELLKAADIKLPKRYHGGLLFGQLVPRFDNRIISRCPITWAKTYDEAIAEGKTDAQARKLADKFAKVPAAKSMEFLEYRFARILANLKADGKPIDKELRAKIWLQTRQRGSMTEPILRKLIESELTTENHNLEAYFKLHPDAGKALIFSPSRDFLRKLLSEKSSLREAAITLPKKVRREVFGLLKRGNRLTLQQISEKIEEQGSRERFLEELTKVYRLTVSKASKNSPKSYAEFLSVTRVEVKDIPSGRAPYARPVLRQVIEEILKGWDATKANKLTDPENGEDKPANGILYDLGIPGSRVRQLQDKRPLDQLTNNHLVRHRMLILERLLDDLAEEFAINDPTDPPGVFIEVARELKEFSGKDRQAIKSAEAAKLAQHKAAEKRLKEKGINPNYSLIRKCRIAMDLNWTCPFTHRTFSESELSELQFEHIIPRSKRLSDSMAGLVLTRPEINAMKGNRTARRFILDHADDDRIVSPEKYKKWVEALKVVKKDTYPDDYARQHARKRLLMIEYYEEKERTFTEGQLSQSSQLMKLAMGVVKRKIAGAAIHPVPGAVTAEIRKGWNLTGTLKKACPEIENEHGETRLKDEIRNLTQLHHALDAATIALIAHYFPFTRHGQNQTGKLWAAMRKRSRTAEEDALLRSTGRYKVCHQKLQDGNIDNRVRLELVDLDASVKNALTRSLAESRVMQHLPADQSGLPTDQLQWRFHGWRENGKAILSKKSITGYDPENRRVRKSDTPKSGADGRDRVFGANPADGIGKLKANKAVLLINENYGIALDPSPQVIPFQNVHQRLKSLNAANGGNAVRVIRSGCTIRIARGQNQGVWIVTSAMASMLLKIKSPHYVSYDETRPLAKKVSLTTLLRDGLEILPRRYTGHPLKD